MKKIIIFIFLIIISLNIVFGIPYPNNDETVYLQLSTNANDDSGNNYDFINTGTFINNYAVLNGSQNICRAIVTQYYDNYGNFTIDFIMNASLLDGTADRLVDISSFQNDGFRLEIQNNQLVFKLQYPGVDDAEQISIAFNTSQEYYLSFVITDNGAGSPVTLDYYIDGIFYDTDDFEVGSRVRANNRSACLGSSLSSSNYFHGGIKQFQITPRAKTSTEINNFYTNSSIISKTLYVDIKNVNCNNSYTREQNNFTNMWCDTKGFSSGYGGSHKLLGGDIVYILEGEYNQENNNNYFYSNSYIFNNITIQSYNNQEVNITNYIPDYASVPNALWTQISSNPNIWTTTYAGLGTNAPILYYENGTKFMTTRCYDESGCSYTRWLTDVNRNRDMVWGDDATNNITIRLKDLSMNPNNVPLYVSEEIGNFRVYNHGGDYYWIFKDLNFKNAKTHIYTYNSSNILIDNCNFTGGYNSVWFRGINEGSPSGNHMVKNSYFDGKWNHEEWYNDDIKNTYEETSSVKSEETTGSVTVFNNTFTNWAGGVTLYTDSQYLNNGSNVSYNTFINGIGSQIEIEKYCYNSTWHNNKIYDSQFGVSFGPANGDSNARCSFYNNEINLDDYILQNETLNYSSYALKLYSAGTGLYVSYWNVHHNTFIGGGKGFYGLQGTNRDHRNSNWTNNIFLSNNQATVEKTGEPQDGVFFDYNSYFRTDGGDIFYRWSNDSSTELYSDLTEAKSSSDWNGVWDINSLDSNPLLIDINSNNLTPYANSPVCTASDTGSYIGALPCSTINYTPPVVPATPSTNTTLDVSEYFNNTRNVVFSALALLSIVFILLAAVLIISIFKTGGDVTEMITTAGTLIGLAIIIIVGYIVINMVSKFV